MGRFNKRSSEGRNFHKREFGRNKDRKYTQKYDAICSNCEKECQLPFKPTGERPVYCRECFEKMGGGESNKSYGRDNNGQSLFKKSPEKSQSSMSIEQFSQLNSKLDRILELLTTSVDKLPEIMNDKESEERK